MPILSGLFRGTSVLAMSAALACASCSGGSAPPPTPELETFATFDANPGSTTLAADPAGNLFLLIREGEVGNPQTTRLAKVTPAGVATFVPVTLGNARAVATDAAGNVYVADPQACDPCAYPVRVAWKIAPDGTVASISAKGSSDDTSPAFPSVSGLAVDGMGNLFISDSEQNTIVRLGTEGDLVTYAGQVLPGVGAELDGTGPNAAFARPSGITLDSRGNLYVADSAGYTIRKVTPDRVVTTVAGRPFAIGGGDGPAALATFAIPTALAVDGDGNVYVADSNNALIRKISRDGVATVVGTHGQRGYAPGPLPGVVDFPFGLVLVGRGLFFLIRNESTTRTLAAPLILVAARNVP